MSKYQSPQKAAERWGVNRETVRLWCHAGYVEGARKVGKNWKIPEETVQQIEEHGMQLPSEVQS